MLGKLSQKFRKWNRIIFRSVKLMEVSRSLDKFLGIETSNLAWLAFLLNFFDKFHVGSFPESCKCWSSCKTNFVTLMCPLCCVFNRSVAFGGKGVFGCQITTFPLLTDVVKIVRVLQNVFKVVRIFNKITPPPLPFWNSGHATDFEVFANKSLFQKPSSRFYSEPSEYLVNISLPIFSLECFPSRMQILLQTSHNESVISFGCGRYGVKL